MLSTKDKILDTVIDFIKETPSLDQVSISQIASKAGIGKSTVYDYFENKDALLEEAYIHLLDQYQKMLFKELPMLSYEDAMKFQLKNILDVMKYAKTIMESIVDVQRSSRLFDFSKCSKKINTIQMKMRERFIEIYQIGFQEGVLKPSDNPYIEHIQQALITGLMFQYINGRFNIEEDELIQLILDEMTKIINNNYHQ